ncbi:MAG: XdhC family protein [Tissierellales bacterium]|nr:XdhC family protein [Tissierellales bacterium]
MIGSKSRVKKVTNHLEETGISKEKLNEVFTPIGLKIGAQTPEEIAIAIIAEIIQVKNQKTIQTAYSDELLKAIEDEKYKNIQKALITIVSRKGSAPRGVGTKMVVMENGEMIGTIGGGCVEADIRQTALFAIKNGKSKLVEVDMTGQEAEDDGMVCGGVLKIFVDPLNVLE